MRQVNKYDSNDVVRVQQPEYGGTGVTTQAEIVDALGLVSKRSLRPGETLIPLDATGVVSTDYIDLVNSRPVSLSGNLIVPKGTTVSFVITDYDDSITPTVAVSAGSVTRTGNTINFTAPNTPQIVDLTVNSVVYKLDVRGTLPGQPSIVSPVHGAVGLGTTINVTGSAYSQGSAGAFKESIWQIADTPNFEPYRELRFSGAVTGVIDQLEPNSTYYLRVCYADMTNQNSNWSAVVGFSTKATFMPSVEVGQFAPTAVLTENGGATSFSSQQGFRVSAVNANGDRRFVLTSDEADIVNSLGYHEFDRAAYVYGKNASSVWVLQPKGTSTLKRIQSATVQDGQFARYVAMSGNGRWMSASAQMADKGNGFLLQYLSTADIVDRLLVPNAALTVGGYFGPHALNNDASRLIMLSGDGMSLIVWRYGVSGWEVAQTLNLNAGIGVGRKAVGITDDGSLVVVTGPGGVEIFRIMEGQSIYMASVKFRAHTATATAVGQMAMTANGDLIAVRLLDGTAPRVEIIEFNLATNTITSKTIPMPTGETRFGESLAVSSDASVLYVGSPGTATGGKVYRYSGVRVGSALVTDMTLKHSNTGNNPTGRDESEYGRSMRFSRQFSELLVASFTRVHVLR